MILACRYNDKELALALVKLGADIEAKDNVSKVWPWHCMTPGVSREECLEAVSQSIGGLALLSRCFDSADVQTAVHTHAQNIFIDLITLFTYSAPRQ